MKVLMLGWELPPHHAGGMGVACYQMCKGLSSAGVDIEFILPYTANFNIDFMKVTGAHPQSADAVKFAGGIYDGWQYSKKTELHSHQLDLGKQHDRYAHNVAKLVESKEFDIIHAHDWLTFRAAIMVKMVTGKPMIAHVHSTQFDQSGGSHGNPEAREIEYAGLVMADQIFAVSQYTKDTMIREYGIDEAKIKVVHNSMEVDGDIDEAHNAHYYLKAMKSNGYKVVVNIGRKTIQKGLTHLVQSAAAVISKNPKVLFVVAGGGEQDDELTALSAAYGISQNIIHVGWINGKELRDTFKIADVFIMPSVSEPFGLVALEAIGYGAPVIISKQSGVSEVLKNCYKVDFWDTDQMADMILALCDFPSLAQTMWRNSFDEYRSQSWQKSVEKMFYHYRETAEVGQ